MIVVLVVIMMLVIGLVVAKPHLTSEAGFGQKFQRSVNGRVADRRIVFLHQPIKVLAGQMLFGLKKDLHYQVALGRSAQAGLLNVLEEYLAFLLKFFFLFHHFVSVFIVLILAPALLQR